MRVRPQLPKNRARWNRHRLIIIGEAPGKTEDELGIPFAGRAGKLLDDMLNQAGIKRRHCVVINPFQQRPPNNNVKYFFTAREYHSPVKREFRRDLRQFNRTLQAYAPAMLIAMGRTAAWATVNYTGTLAPRIGKLILCDHGLVMQLYHPAAFLRGNPNLDLPQQIRQLKLAKLIGRNLL